MAGRSALEYLHAAERARAAVPRPYRGVRDAVQREQLERLRVVARRHLDLVAPGPENADQRSEERHLRRVRDIDPNAHGVTLAFHG